MQNSPEAHGYYDFMKVFLKLEKFKKTFRKYFFSNFLPIQKNQVIDLKFVKIRHTKLEESNSKFFLNLKSLNNNFNKCVKKQKKLKFKNKKIENLKIV